MALKNYKSFPLLEEYLNYLLVIKGRSINTIIEYRTDNIVFFQFLNKRSGVQQEKYDLSNVDAAYIKSVTLNDMYAFISHCQNDKLSAAGTRSRKIVSIRQFWKCLKTKAHAIDNNVSEELETPKIPKRIPKYLNLEESIRLLIECEKSPRDHCIITMFLKGYFSLTKFIYRIHQSKAPRPPPRFVDVRQDRGRHTNYRKDAPQSLPQTKSTGAA